MAILPMNATEPHDGGGESGKRRRRPPSPTEQARRKAWGHRWGPLTGAAIRNALARMEKR